MQHTPFSFNGLDLCLGNLARLSSAQSRSICPENPDGRKSGGGRALVETDENGQAVGPARELGQGWKVRPSVVIAPRSVFELGCVDGSGAIQSIWMTAAHGFNRNMILRIYWDEQEIPSVEVPVSDFFAAPYLQNRKVPFAQISSLAVCVNPGNAYCCFWQMPFRKGWRMTLENRNREDVRVYYQINYTLTEVPYDVAYFHACFRRTNPVMPGQVHTLVDGVRGRGHYVGSAMAWQTNHNGWWGEGEIKFYLDGDAAAEVSGGKCVGGSNGFPTICGTGTEDYFLGSHNFENFIDVRYQEFCGPYGGLSQVLRPDGVYSSNTRFAMYRWHILDPIRFEQDLKVTIQALGWRSEKRFLQSFDDVASVAYWYQTLPTVPLSPLQSDDEREII